MIFYGQDGDGSQLDKIGPPFSSKAPELSKKDKKRSCYGFLLIESSNVFLSEIQAWKKIP